MTAACRLHPVPARDCPACGLAADAEHTARVNAHFDANDAAGSRYMRSPDARPVEVVVNPSAHEAAPRDVVAAIVTAARRRVAS